MNCPEKSKSDGLYRVKSYLSDLGYLGPALILFVTFVIVPFAQGIPIAFYKWDGISPTRTWVGLQNFKTVLIDPAIRNALVVSVKFMLYGLVFSILFGLAFAMLLHRKRPGANLARSLIFLPYVISGVLTSYIWQYTYSGFFYEMLGIRNPLTAQSSAIFGVSVLSVWHNTGFCMVIFIAGLNAVPEDLYEAAKMEGANAPQRFFHVTLPMISSSFTVTVTMLLAFGMKIFDFPYIVTQGGPGRATESLAIAIYRNIFTYWKAGYGQAIAYVFTLFLFVVTFAASKLMRSWEVEQ